MSLRKGQILPIIDPAIGLGKNDPIFLALVHLADMLMAIDLDSKEHFYYAILQVSVSFCHSAKFTLSFSYPADFIVSCCYFHSFSLSFR